MTKVQRSDNLIGCQLTTATYLDVWVMGRFDWDLNIQTEIKSSIKPIPVPESMNKFFRRQFASIIDPKSSYVCLGHLRWITADLHEYTNNTRELQSAWGRAAKVGEMPNGGGVPFGTCNVWFTEHLLLPNRKTRWGWLKTTFFDEKTPLEDVWPSPVLPSSLIFPLNTLPFGPQNVFPVQGQVYAALKVNYPYYDLGWNATCGGWSHGERNCSDFYDVNPFVFVTRYHNGSELLSLKLGQKVLRTYLFEPSILVPLAYLPSNQTNNKNNNDNNNNNKDDGAKKEGGVDKYRGLVPRSSITYHSSKWEQLWLDNIVEWQGKRTPSYRQMKHKGTICEQLKVQEEEYVWFFMNSTCTHRTSTPWCLIDDTMNKLWYHTEEHTLKRHKSTRLETFYADKAYQCCGGQAAYDRVMAVGVNKRAAEFDAVQDLFAAEGVGGFGPAVDDLDQLDGKLFALQPVQREFDPKIWSYFEWKDPLTGANVREFIEPLVSHLRHPLAKCNTANLGDALRLDRSYILPPTVSARGGEAFYFDAGSSAWKIGVGE